MTFGGNRQRGIRGSRRGSDPRGNARDRRGEDIRFGPEFEYRDGQWRLRTTGALVVNNRGEVELEVLAPLTQASPLRLDLDPETIQVVGNMATVKLAKDGGLTKDSGGLRADPATGRRDVLLIRTVTGSTALGPASGIVEVDATGGDITITFLRFANGQTVHIVRIDSSSNVVTLSANINGATSLTLLPDESASLYWNGSQFRIR